ncbi:hypothetical protein AUP74_00370 [Microbulbifer aggregans]|uniref:Gram-negative bacterial tonB protein n=1 Tax=Microbulbifer aggregans TaxID=1769779 RepID=A0A1C9W3V4_9GAMM|nr:hypothetical protein [Microbulbifer aggregans]AOS95841.1 hypothetical protein AUP74_00370 [Microbulbifer aggregans]
MKKVYFILVFIALVLSTFVTADEKYSIEGDAPVGTKFKSKDAVSSLPFDKPYAKLSQAEKNLFANNYGGLQSTEIPPFPKNGLQDIYLPIIRGHHKHKREGKLFAIAMISEHGKVEKVDVYKAPSKKMAELATVVLFNTDFDNATCNGSPCKMEFPLDMYLEVTF